MARRALGQSKRAGKHDNTSRLGVSTEWCRFDSYAVEADHIVPSKGAKPNLFSIADERGRGLSHEALLTLAAELRKATHDDDTAQLVLRWCNKYGLLGLMPHETRVLVLSPTWERRKDAPTWLAKTQRRYIRRGATWAVDGVQSVTQLRLPRVGRANREIPYSSEHEGKLVTLSDDDGLLEPSVERRVQGLVEVDRLSRLAEWYFPGVQAIEADTYCYPQPLTSEFWQQYTEPLDDFVRTVRRFERVVNLETTASLRATSRIPKREDALNDYMDGISIHFEEGTFDQAPRLSWQVPSLLGFFALSASESLASGASGRVCKSCGNAFISRAYQARYCSPRCRYRVQKSRQRSRESVADGHRSESEMLKKDSNNANTRDRQDAR